MELKKLIAVVDKEQVLDIRDESGITSHYTGKKDRIFNVLDGIEKVVNITTRIFYEGDDEIVYMIINLEGEGEY